jgi:hypothetical protein
MGGLRALYHDKAGLVRLETLQWKPELGAWVQGHGDQGRWSDRRAAAAYRAFFAAQAASKDLRKAAVQRK